MDECLLLLVLFITFLIQPQNQEDSGLVIYHSKTSKCFIKVNPTIVYDMKQLEKEKHLPISKYTLSM